MKTLLAVLAATFSVCAFPATATEEHPLTARYWAYYACAENGGEYQDLMLLDRPQTFVRDFIVLGDSNASITYQSPRDLVRASNWGGDFPDFVFVRQNTGWADTVYRAEVMTPIVVCRFGEWLLVDFPHNLKTEHDQK